MLLLTFYLIIKLTEFFYLQEYECYNVNHCKTYRLISESIKVKKYKPILTLQDHLQMLFSTPPLTTHHYAWQNKLLYESLHLFSYDSILQ